ncbi:MAG: hypothetical protein HOQ11_07070 [Gemmatimonadaceae bacterium]|nr:hypothetical protein [Gemmatimonadaceae bacterium]NUQ92986.1 hypothetical protein [Gemmatimonadaceae bacterium]NUR19040.1 hypothetical protein [Gemmatimonadaceae bacterium]NUS97152.1 hypothetical protein [Gemmatimonadaceae bacterium]
MTGDPSTQALSFVRVRAVAVVRLRRLVRTRRLALATLMTMLPWLIVEQELLVARISALTEFTVVGLTVLVAGAVAEDLDGGQYAISLTHDCRPVELLAGELAAALAVAFLLVALQLPVALRGAVASNVAAVMLCLAWLAALLAGWISLMLLFATVIEGVGNAVAMIPLLILPSLLSATTVLDRLPSLAAGLIRLVLDLAPTPRHAAALYQSLLLGAPLPRIAPLVLAAAPVAYFALAALRLSRMQPAGRVAA